MRLTTSAGLDFLRVEPLEVMLRHAKLRSSSYSAASLILGQIGVNWPKLYGENTVPEAGGERA